jgi:hypothetical protein|tara:strand:+ start:536 stop:772 length:237 start_codon:yes stop_codon:yes gene_type:complete
MKVKMKVDLKGAAGNGETTIMYNAGQTYEMKTKLEMEMAGVWLSDGRAEKAKDTIEKKIVKQTESKAKKVVKKILGKK